MPLSDLLQRPLQQETPQRAINKPKFGFRRDGTPKGSGFLGILQMPGGNVATELSVGVNFDGKEQDIPTLVPTLSSDEVQLLLNLKGDERIPGTIIRKAVLHAKDRFKQGLSPFND